MPITNDRTTSVPDIEATAGKDAYRAAATESTSLAIVTTAAGKSLRLRKQLGLNRETFARMVPMSTRSLANIEAGKRPPASALRQLRELHRLIDALSAVIPVDALGAWLVQPNDAFDGLKPIEVIERGEADRLWRMAFYLASGVAS